MNKSKIIHNNPNILQMKKFFTNLLSCCLVATSFGFAHFAEAAPFELEYNFDDDAGFPQGVDLPEGWVESGNTVVQPIISVSMPNRVIMCLERVVPLPAMCCSPP